MNLQYTNRFQRDTNFPQFEKFDLNKQQPVVSIEVSEETIELIKDYINSNSQFTQNDDGENAADDLAFDTAYHAITDPEILRTANLIKTSTPLTEQDIRKEAVEEFPITDDMDRETAMMRMVLREGWIQCREKYASTTVKEEDYPKPLVEFLLNTYGLTVTEGKDVSYLRNLHNKLHHTSIPKETKVIDYEKEAEERYPYKPDSVGYYCLSVDYVRSEYVKWRIESHNHKIN